MIDDDAPILLIVPRDAESRTLRRDRMMWGPVEGDPEEVRSWMAAKIERLVPDHAFDVTLVPWGQIVEAARSARNAHRLSEEDLVGALGLLPVEEFIYEWGLEPSDLTPEGVADVRDVLPDFGRELEGVDLDIPDAPPEP